MEITVKLFGQIADIVGNTSLKIDDVADTIALTKKMQVMFPALSGLEYAVGVNKKIIQGNTTLQHDAEVAILPPFSGG